MRWKFRICVVAASAFALASCTPPEIKIVANRVNGHQVITLTQDWGLIFSDKRAPCVDRVELSENGKPLWRFDARTDQCVDLGSFTVGKVPPGFVERISLPPTARGRFHVMAVGVGIGEAQIDLP